ncbi:hypothetical protein MYX84_07085 [Acidobacteria bacterium AH-259-O06]|nr:hypothetical protein [Acidobacteria bacterium AH-259-O06]
MSLICFSGVMTLRRPDVYFQDISCILPALLSRSGVPRNLPGTAPATQKYHPGETSNYSQIRSGRLCTINRKSLNRKEIGLAEYNRGRASVSRAIKRLAARGLILTCGGGQFLITERGREYFKQKVSRGCH